MQEHVAVPGHSLLYTPAVVYPLLDGLLQLVPRVLVASQQASKQQRHGLACIDNAERLYSWLIVQQATSMHVQVPK